MAKFSMMPRKGHLERLYRLFGYLKHNYKGRIVFDPTPPDLSCIKFIEKNWTDLYPDAQEYLPESSPPTHNKTKLAVTYLEDASHANNLMNRRSVTAYMGFIGNMPIAWYSKSQNTVESSTYRSELVAMRITIEAILGLRYKLRMMGLDFEETSTVLCDNASVVTQTQYPSSSLKKKHNDIAYHKVREAVAAKIVKTGHISTKYNTADIGTKALSPADHYSLTNNLLYGRNRGDTPESEEEKEK